MVAVVVLLVAFATLATSVPQTGAYYKQNLTEGEKISNGQYLMVADNTSPTLVPPWLAMQRDCNFVLYNQTGRAVWSTGTYGQGLAGSCYATVKDCNLLVYSGKGTTSTLWNASSNIISAMPPCFATVLLANTEHAPTAVLYDSVYTLLWSSEEI